MFAHCLKAQNDISLLSLEFLEINAQAQSKALGDVGVVTPSLSTHAASQQNPALLIHGPRKIDVNIKYMPWLRARGLSHFFLELGGSCTFSKRHAIGLNLKYLSDGLLKLPPSGFRSDYAVTMSYAYQFSEKWSGGTNIKLIRSDVFFSDKIIGLNFKAFDFGIHYKNNKELTKDRKLHFNWGAALTNLGPKVKLEKLYPGTEWTNYLPASLKIGVLVAIEKTKSNRYKRTRSFAYQIDKRLVPMSSSDDFDNNGIPDYLEWNVGPSLFQSFVDSPDGLKGELAELVHKFGFEYRIEDQKYDYVLAFRLGYHHANTYLFNRKNVSAGFALSLAKIYFDLAYVTSLDLDQAIYENTFLFSVGTRQYLGRK